MLLMLPLLTVLGPPALIFDAESKAAMAGLEF